MALSSSALKNPRDMIFIAQIGCAMFSLNVTIARPARVLSATLPDLPTPA
jgi:hypothetical protein